MDLCLTAGDVPYVKAYLGAQASMCVNALNLCPLGVPNGLCTQITLVNKVQAVKGNVPQ